MENLDGVASSTPSVTDSRSKPLEGWTDLRSWAHTFAKSKRVENVMAGIIMLNVALMVWEVDIRGACKWRDIDEEECITPVWVSVANVMFLLVYTGELSIRFFAWRWRFFFKFWNCLEFFIVMLGFVDWALSLQQTVRIPNLMFLRLFRLCKLLRTVTLLHFFPELYELLRGFYSASYAMLWGAVLICIMLGFWSMMAVEFAPAPSDLGPTYRGHEIPEWCHDAFSSVSFAMLFFFQTLIAGDSWGMCTIPMIRQNPLTLVVFMGALITIELGVTNLILAVIVESAANEREKDQKTKLRKKLLHEQQGLARWRAMVQEIDTDSSGTISLEELMAGFDSHPETRQCLQLLDVDERDLHDFFHLLDHDRSGDLSYDEFFRDLQKAHTQDTRMFLLNLKLQIAQMSHMLRDHLIPGEAVVAPAGQSLSKRPSRSPRPSKPMGSEGKAESDLPSSEWRSGVSPGTDKLGASPRSPKTPGTDNYEVSDPFLRKLQGQLDQLTQDACAQAEMLVRNTTMLEALLASCNVEDPSKTSQWSSRSRRQHGGAHVEADVPESPQVSNSVGGALKAGNLPWARIGPTPGRALGGDRDTPLEPAQGGTPGAVCV